MDLGGLAAAVPAFKTKKAALAEQQGAQLVRAVQQVGRPAGRGFPFVAKAVQGKGAVDPLHMGALDVKAAVADHQTGALAPLHGLAHQLRLVGFLVMQVRRANFIKITQEPRMFQCLPSKRPRLAGGHPQAQAARLQIRQQGLHAREGLAVQHAPGGIMLAIAVHGLLGPGRIQPILDGEAIKQRGAQHPLSFLRRQGRQAQLLLRLGKTAEYAGTCVQQGAVQVEDHGAITHETSPLFVMPKLPQPRSKASNRPWTKAGEILSPGTARGSPGG